MDIERIARKLEPLMPRQVKHWLRVRQSAGAEMTSMIDSQIINTAYKVLGDIDKPLLSLPPEEKAKGTFHLGTVLYEKDKWSFGLSESELLQNLAIFGRSGAGKTNVAFHLLEQLAERGVPFLFLDWKRTGRHLLPRLKGRVNVYTPGRALAPFVFNPFILPPGLEPNVYLFHVVDVLARAYDLGEGAKSLLQKTLASFYRAGNLSPTADELLQAIESMNSKGRVREWSVSAIRALESISLAALGQCKQGTQEETARKLLQESTIIELDGLSDASKQFVVPLLCLWLFQVKLAEKEREKLSLVIVVEEAHHVLYRGERSRTTVMEEFLRQCRELGIGVVIVDQHPSLISQAALGNCFATLFLNLKDPSDINKAASLAQVEDGEKWHFSALPIGQGIVKLQNRWHRPFVVGFPHVHVEKGAVDDQALSEYLENPSRFRRSIKPENNALGLLGLNNKNLGTLGQSPPLDKVFNEEGMVLIKDILAYPDSGVDERYKRLDMSVEKGNRLKNQLLKARVIESLKVLSGRTRKIILRPTAKAREQLGLASGEVTQESIAHEYWKRFYARLFEGRGYRVELEEPRRQGNVDVLAVKTPETEAKASESVAIEIETGKSDVVWNVKQDLLMGWRVLVVATGGEALAKVEREIAKAGLLIPRRVRIVVAGEVEGVRKIR